MDRRTPDHTSPLQLSSLATTSQKALTYSPSSSEDSIPIAMTPSPTITQDVSSLTKQAKHDLIAQLACDPQAVSLMEEIITTSTRGESSDSNVGSTNNKPYSLNLGDVSSVSRSNVPNQSEASLPPPATSHAGDLLSPPVEFRSLDPSRTFYGHQTSTTSTQTDEELSLTRVAGSGSIASSRGTGSTSGYDSSLTQGERRLTDHSYTLSLCDLACAWVY